MMWWGSGSGEGHILFIYFFFVVCVGAEERSGFWTAFPKINTTVSMIFSDISRHARVTVILLHGDQFNA